MGSGLVQGGALGLDLLAFGVEFGEAVADAGAHGVHCGTSGQLFQARTWAFLAASFHVS